MVHHIFLVMELFEEAFSKNTIYHFMNNARTNWQRFTTLLSAGIINGFMKPLTDEKRKDVFIIDDSLFGRSLAGRRRLQSRRKATDVMVELVHSAQCAGITARYVLFDSWFSAPKTILALKKTGTS